MQTLFQGQRPPGSTEKPFGRLSEQAPTRAAEGRWPGRLAPAGSPEGCQGCRQSRQGGLPANTAPQWTQSVPPIVLGAGGSLGLGGRLAGRPLGLGQSPRAGGHRRQDSCRDVQVPGGQWSLLPLGRVTELCTVPCPGPGGVGPASTRENVRLARELRGQCPGGTDPPAPLPPAPSPYGLLPDPPTVKLATSGSLTPGCSSPCLPKTDVLFQPRFRTTDVYPGRNITT